MHLLPGGPRIPNDVLSAHEEGTLAIVCGAGVSYPNGLPLFDGLVREVWESFGAASLPDVAAAMDRDEYDRAMSYLERHYTAPVVRGRVRDILRVPEAPDLATHRALLDLARDKDGRLHLVTTNFDLLFEIAEADLRSTRAPTLPVPKPEKWDGVCYLHGRFDDADREGRHLVMTSADFGTAYLSERWASRFVSEMFAHFTVLFVGYSLNDPVMRYLVDAIAAERGSGRPWKPVFAFVGRGPDVGVDELEAEWDRKNVVPIPYEVDSHYSDAPHGILHATLQEWASVYRGGLESRKNIVFELGTRDPDALLEEDHSRFLWAIKEGAVAEHLADLGEKTSFGWVRVLEDQIGRSAIREPHSVALFDWGQRTQVAAPLGEIPRQIARWLVSHVANPALLRWVVEKGWRPHPEVRRQVWRSIERAGDAMPPGLAAAWSALLSADVLPYSERWDRDAYELVKPLQDSPWNAALRRRLLQALSPGLVFGRSIAGLFDFSEGRAEKSTEDLTIHDLLDARVDLAAGNSTQSVFEAVMGRDDKDEVLADLAWDLVALLRQALDILAAAERAGPTEDPGWIAQPSVGHHPQNHHHDGWTWLIELNREAFDALRRTDREQADHMSEAWARIEYPTFRRLTMYAAAQLTRPDDA